MTPEKSFHCIAPKTASHINGTGKVSDDQCDVNVTQNGKLVQVRCTEWEFADDGRFTLRVRQILNIKIEDPKYH